MVLVLLPIISSSPVGPWLGKLFPDVIGDHIRPTRQEVYYFRIPAGEKRFSEGAFPVWADHQARLVYGIPAADGGGLKIADDTRGPLFDPTNGDRTVTPDLLAHIRKYLDFRFPAMKNAPLIESYVCPCENSPDGNFIIDRYPDAKNVWLVGGGSGHRFKHSPAVGEMVSQAVLGEKSPPLVLTCPIWNAIIERLGIPLG